MKATVALIGLLLMSASLNDAQAKANASCFGRLAEPLRKGGFAPGVDCADYDHELKIKKIGTINYKANSYTIYNLTYIVGISYRGGSRILFFDKKMNYLGEYHGYLYRDVWINGRDLYVKEMSGVHHVTIPEGGPPLDSGLDDYELLSK